MLVGRVVVEKVHSEINGELTVVRDLTYGTYIRGGGLPQSGGLAEQIWKHTLGKLEAQNLEFKTCLIVGLGGGSIAKIIRRNWPKAKITGIDIDTVIVELGRKYLKLDEQEVNIIIGDAYYLITGRQSPIAGHYDLICFDTYIQQDFPKKFEAVQFIKQVKKLLSKDGVAVFNRLYGQEERDSAIRFEKLLKKVFNRVDRLYPEANIMFVCSL